jgi:hypothetical protein
MANEQKPNVIGHVRTFEIVQYVTAPLEGKLDDWPANIQDAVYAALDRKAAEVQLPLCIVDSACQVDYGDTPEEDKFFLRIIASEIVAVDVGYEKRMIDEAMKKLH